MTVTPADFRRALAALGFFSPAWFAICRDRSVKDARVALDTFVIAAETLVPDAVRAVGQDAADLAIAAIRGHRVQGARRPHASPVPYLYPVTASAWRTIEVV